jgi:hypothetical protein
MEIESCCDIAVCLQILLASYLCTELQLIVEQIPPYELNRHSYTEDFFPNILYNTKFCYRLQKAPDWTVL